MPGRITISSSRRCSRSVRRTITEADNVWFSPDANPPMLSTRSTAAGDQFGTAGQSCFKGLMVGTGRRTVLGNAVRQPGWDRWLSQTAVPRRTVRVESEV